MRRITFTEPQFKNFVFPHVGRSNANSGSDWETALRLIKKLKDPTLTEEVDLTQDEQESENDGATVFRFRTLLTREATFELEEDEWKLLRQILEGMRTKVLLIAAEDFEAILEIVREAKQVDTKEKKKEKVEA